MLSLAYFNFIFLLLQNTVSCGNGIKETRALDPCLFCYGMVVGPFGILRTSLVVTVVEFMVMAISS